MSLSPANLFISLVITTLGYAYFSYGRRRPAPVFVVAGLLLMTYSYFVQSMGWTVAIGVGLLAAPFAFR